MIALFANLVASKVDIATSKKEDKDWSISMLNSNNYVDIKVQHIRRALPLSRIELPLRTRLFTFKAYLVASEIHKVTPKKASEENQSARTAKDEGKMQN